MTPLPPLATHPGRRKDRRSSPARPSRLPDDDPRAKTWNALHDLGTEREGLEDRHAKIRRDTERLVRAALKPGRRHLTWEEVAGLTGWSRAKIHTVLGWVPPAQRDPKAHWATPAANGE